VPHQQGELPGGTQVSNASGLDGGHGCGGLEHTLGLPRRGGPDHLPEGHRQRRERDLERPPLAGAERDLDIVLVVADPREVDRVRARREISKL
ncbi:hypothetical protein DF186_15585, partial [Enterococcus hirae]